MTLKVIFLSIVRKVRRKHTKKCVKIVIKLFKLNLKLRLLETERLAWIMVCLYVVMVIIQVTRKWFIKWVSDQIKNKTIYVDVNIYAKNIRYEKKERKKENI